MGTLVARVDQSLPLQLGLQYDLVMETHDDTKDQLQARLALAEAAGYTQKQIAELAGVPDWAVRKFTSKGVLSKPNSAALMKWLRDVGIGEDESPRFMDEVDAQLETTAADLINLRGVLTNNSYTSEFRMGKLIATINAMQDDLAKFRELRKQKPK